VQWERQTSRRSNDCRQNYFSEICNKIKHHTSNRYKEEVTELEFGDIYERYFKDVYLYMLAVSKNADVAEEITQETFFKALKEIKKFKGNCSVKSWLCQIAKNLYVDQMRKKRNVSLSEVKEAAVFTDIEENMIDKNDAISIYKILHCLDEPYKEVFTLRVLGELSFKEIADIFSKNESWARVTYHRARLKIRELME